MNTMRILTLVLAALIFAPASFGDDQVFERADDTWPLRLAGGDDTWPLRFLGEAVTLPGNPGRAVPADLRIQFVNRRVMLPNQAARLSCRDSGPTVQKHEARGTVIVEGVARNIVGICYNRTTKVMEVVAERGAAGTRETTTMIGTAPNESNRTFRGRLSISGAAGGDGRFKFSINCVESHGGGYHRGRHGGDGSIPTGGLPAADL